MIEDNHKLEKILWNLVLQIKILLNFLFFKLKVHSVIEKPLSIDLDFNDSDPKRQLK